MNDESQLEPKGTTRLHAQDGLVIRPQETQVPDGDPWSDDRLDRSGTAEELTRLLKNEHSISVSLSGGWGTGKTYLLQRWAKDLQDQGARVAYVNAWESDFSHDPIIPVTSTIVGAMRDTRFSGVARALTREAKEFVLTNAEGLIEKYTGFRIPIKSWIKSKDLRQADPYQARLATMEKLRQALSKLAQGAREDTGYPLVVIIDELDRCRPDYAVELLERVKHVLMVENTAFVFGINRQALGEAIGHRFGISDIDGYLAKFFDADAPLPRPASMVRMVVDRAYNQQGLGSLRAEYLGYAESRDEEPYDGAARAMNHATGKIVDHLATMADIVRLKPREVKHCLRLVTMALAKMEPDSATYAELVAPMVLFKVRDQRLYESYVSGKSLAGEILDHLDLPGLRNRQDTVESMRRTEVLFYLADSLGGKTPALAELKSIQNRLEVIRPELLSEKTRTEGNPAHVQALIKAIESEPGSSNGLTWQTTAAQKWAAAREVISSLLDLSPRLEVESMD